MTRPMFAIFDKAVGAFLAPFVQATEAQAIRTIQESLRDPQNPMARTLGDYALFHVGDFDDADGSLKALASPARKVFEFLQLKEGN